jgi:hypothetical protein
MRNLLRSEQPGTVLAGVKATPCGWPTASPDPGCGGAERRPAEQIERKQSKIHPTQSLRFEGIAATPSTRPTIERVNHRQALRMHGCPQT